MEDEISNEKLYIELRKAHRRSLAAVALISIEFLIVLAVLDGFIPATGGAAVVALTFGMSVFMAYALKKGGLAAEVAEVLFDSAESEPEVKQRLGKE